MAKVEVEWACILLMAKGRALAMAKTQTTRMAGWTTSLPRPVDKAKANKRQVGDKVRA